MRPHGPWKIVSSRQVYNSEWIKVQEDSVVKPDGKPGTYSTIMLKSGISVLPIDNEGSVYLVKEFKYALGKEDIEAVSGAMEEGEEPQAAARRELEEELGIAAEELIPLGRVDFYTSIVQASPAWIFLARGLKFGKARPEGTEVIEPLKVSLDEAVQMAMDGRITHAQSCVLVLKAKEFLKANK